MHRKAIPLPYPPQNHPHESSASAAVKTRKLPWGNLAVTTLCLIGAVEAQAQTKRCDLVGRDTSITGNPARFKRCLDLSGLDGKTITVPSNVTRIDNDGLSLCKGSLRLGGDADIVFVMDESGSMGASHAYINTSVTPNDTTYFYGTGGCTAGFTTMGTFQYQAFEGIDAAPVPVLRTVTRISSDAGCTDLSGDPYKVRANAVEKAIDYIAASGTQISTLGYAGFAGSNRTTVSPLVVNAANVTTLKTAIDIEEANGTNYYDALNQAKTWLKNPALIKTSKQAIVFISDGKPTQGANALTLADGTLPAIYSIYLAQRATPDTAVMKKLSDTTGGKFYRVPGQEPDSVVKIVQQILNLILKEYQPNTALISNNSLSPVQSANAAMPGGFTLQPDGSWLMQLNDIIGLRPSASNAISVQTHFLEKNGPGSDNQTITFTLATTDPATTTTTNLSGKPFGVACYDKSALAIQKSDGTRPAFFTNLETAYRLRLRTSANPLDSALYPARTPLKGDAESPVKKPATVFTDSLVFDGTFPFAVISGARTNGNGTLESGLYDSILVSWVHPRDAQDAASDFMVVRAPKQAATVWFSQTNGGAATTQYLVDATTVFVVVTDQPADPRRTYSAVVSSEKFGIDRETVALAESAPGSGILLGKITISPITKTAGDNLLQVSAGGDQLRVVYKDLVDNDSAVATAGFDENVQEAATLEFTDAAGTALAPGAIWSPANGKLYFKYSDDYAYGRVSNKNIALTLTNLKYGSAIGADHERIVVAMEAGSSGTRAVWTGSIDLLDAFPAADSNGKAETRFRGEAVISAFGHDNVGAQLPGTVTDNLVIAYPDSQAVITWKLDGTVTPKTNEGLIITVNDQTFTLNQKDTALVSIACTKSGDSVASFPAVEGTATSGIYISGTVVKDTAVPNYNDKILSCLITDQIRIRYVDPVYGTLTELLIDEVARPEASPAGRKFITSELVTLTTATPGAVIYYTTDGSNPVPGTSPIYTDAIRVSLTTTIKAIAVKPGFKNSKIMSQTWTKEFTASRLEILDENGNAIPDGSVTGSAKALKIKLVTTLDNLGSAQASATTKVSGDAETVILNNSGSLGNAMEFTQLAPLKHPSAKDVGNDTIEATGTDTLIVRWVNPYDPNDVAADTVIIKPAFVAAEVYFSATENGPRITEYPVGQDSIYIVVITRPRDTSLTYTVTVTSSDGSGDREVLILTQLSPPGVFSAKASVGIGIKAKGDNALQVAAAGDQLTAVFTDPVYKTDYRGDAGFAQQVQESASLEFIDETGKVIAPADVWNPAKGKVYLRFSDDWNAGIDLLIQTKAARLTLVNRKAGDSIGADVETATLALKSHSATRGIWEGSLTLADKEAARNGNDTVETYFRGELRAAVTPHNNAGLAVTPDAVDNLVIAYPDQPAEIVIRDLKGGNVDRQTDKVEIIIRDQPFTKSGDPSINAEVGCAVSGDKVAKVVLVWDGTAYVIKPPLDKGELVTGSADKNDALLLCRDSDILTVTYIDPVYLQPRSGNVKWNDDPVPKMYYASAKDTSVITSAADGSVKDFLIVVEGKSITRDQVDTVLITLTTAQGEKEIYPAIESGEFTGRYIVKAGFRFGSADPIKDDKIVEARITVANRVNQVLVNGTAKVGTDNVAADLSLLSSYDLVVKAYMKDEDENGRADHAYFVFDHKLSKLPSSLEEVYWNQEGADYKKRAEGSQLSFKPGSDSTVVAADFSASQFGANLTDIPAGAAPFGHFPDDNLFGGQKPALADSMGPVPVTAVKHPSNLQSYNVTTTVKRFNPDTLVITVSERIKTTTTFEEMLRFSKGCSDYKESNPVRLFSPPSATADGLTWTVIVDNAPEAQAPLTGDCIFLEADGRYTDLMDNRVARLGVPLAGDNPKLTIREFRGFPPVAGLDAGTPGFLISTNDNRDDAAGKWSQPTGTGGSWEVVWIPPYGFEADDPVGSLKGPAKDFDNPQTGERRPEVAGPQPMPTNISAVQVIASGAYKAQIRIYDNFGHFVRYMEQAYGFNGENKNPWRATDKGQVSFLVWDMKDELGNKVGQGVFVWKVSFLFVEKNKKSEVMYTRTGVLRRK